MKKLILMTLMLLGTTSALANGRTAIGSGGGVIRLPDGSVVPADLYYRQRNFELPNHYLRELTRKEFPETFRELDLIQDFLLGIYVPLHRNVKFDDFEFYLTPIFFGDDYFETTTGVMAEQVAFTYHFTQPSPDFSTSRTRRIVEVKPDVFAKLTPRHQALILLHEVLHHVADHDHNLISPFIQHLDAVLPILDRQRAGEMKALSPQELQTWNQLVNILKQYGFLKYSRRNRIHFFGGGVIETWTGNGNLLDDNFVSIDSYLVEHGSTGYPKVSGNIFKSSRFGLGMVAGGFLCNDSSFENVTMRAVYCTGERQTLKNIKSEGELWIEKSGVALENIDVAITVLIFKGYNIKVKDLKISSREINHHVIFDGGDGAEFVFDSSRPCTLKEDAPYKIVLTQASDLRQWCQ